MLKERLQRSLRAMFVGMAVNALLAVGKLLAGIIGHSYALIADAFESFADICSSLIVWRGILVAAEPADEDHPYGHGKAEPIAAAIVSTMLLLAAAGIAAQAIRHIIEPRPAPEKFTLAVLLIAVALKETLFRFVSSEAEEIESSVVAADAWHHRADAITSLSAATGITIALIGGKGYEKADSIAALVAAVIIAWNGLRLLRPAISELMDRVPAKTFDGDIRKIAAEVSGVDAVEKCIVRKMGYQYFVDMHVHVNPKMTVENAHRIAHQVKDRIRETLPSVSDVLVHIEPSGTEE